MQHAGQQAGNYVLLERIGMGGMAEVFRAASRGVEGFERPVAIKRILPNLTADDDFVKMFVDEAKIAVQLQHPNIVEIFDLARDEDDLFIAMEYVHGKDLRAILDRVQGPDGRRGRLPIELAVHLTARICDALHHAHFAHGPSGQPLGIIHRDVSPQNVIVSFDGEVKVTDFGLAKAAGRAVQTQAGVVKGKLAYMSPEQLRGQPIDQRSDVYGVGILLWEMLTGLRLFLGKNDQETLRRVYQAQVQSPRAVRPELHPELERIALRALAKDIADRYATAEEMQEDLTAYLYGVGPSMSTPGVSAFMRALYPQADPVPEPSSLPPARITARGAKRPDVQTSRPRANTRQREDGSAELRPSTVSQRPEPSSGFSLDDLEDIVEELPESRPVERLTRAVRPSQQVEDGSELMRTVLHRAMSTTAETRPPPRPEPEEDTNRGFVLARSAPSEEERPVGFHQEVSITSANQPRVFRRPNDERSTSALSAPRMPSIEALIEEALAEEALEDEVESEALAREALAGDLDDEGPHATHPFGAAYAPQAPAPFAPDAQFTPESQTLGFESQALGFDDEEPTQFGRFDEATEGLGEPQTRVGGADEIARLRARWDAELTPQHAPRRRR